MKPPTSLRQLIAYLSVHPRVRIIIAEVLDREVTLNGYDHQRLYWSDGGATLLCSLRRTESEIGIEFDAVGVTVHLSFLSTRIEYLP